MRLKDIEKLRAAALLMVLTGHLPVTVPPLLIHGYTGVVIFFMISGYVCCLSLERAQEGYAKSARPRLYSTLEFYIARFFRVIPLILIWLMIYFLCSQVTIFLGGSYGDTERFLKELSWWNTGLYNYYFAYSGAPGLFGHMWSMAIELQFYLFLPIFYLVLPNAKTRKIGCVCLIALSFVFLAMTPDSVAGKLTHTQMGSLFIGMLIYLNREQWKEPLFLRKITRARKWIGGGLLIAIFIIPYWMDGTASPGVKYAIYYVLGGALLYTAQLDNGWYVSGKRITALSLKVATVSFSTYVSHILLFSCIYYNLYVYVLLPVCPWLTTDGGIALQAVGLICCAMGIGWLSTILIEKPYAIYSKKVTMNLQNRLLKNVGGTGK